MVRKIRKKASHHINLDNTARHVLVLAACCVVGWVLITHNPIRLDPGLLISSDITSSAAQSSRTSKSISFYDHYQPAPAEEYILRHLKELNMDASNPDKVATCHIWTNPSSTPHYNDLRSFLSELKVYYQKVENFRLEDGISDLRHHLSENSHESFCSKLDLHPDGLLRGIFSKSQQLSFTRSGYVEPLLPPMRNPNICFNQTRYLMNTQYFVHDFASLCRSLKPTSRTIFIDMGASLDFHINRQSPVVSLWHLYAKFGIPFDHIYAYEMSQTNPKQVFEKVPEHLKAAYHWINVGVESNPKSSLNPWNVILDHYNEDDLVVVKLDIDSPDLERELAHQLLEHPRLTKLIDHFYFEHHVNQFELYPHWGASGTKESVKDSLELFRGLREKGVASHFWV